MTFPADGPWELPAREWHFDFMPAAAGPRMMLTQMVGSVLCVPGGANLAMAGQPVLAFDDGRAACSHPR